MQFKISCQNSCALKDGFRKSGHISRLCICTSSYLSVSFHKSIMHDKYIEESFNNLQHPATPFKTKEVHDYLTKCNMCSDG